jgi:hypothetical protein
LVHEAKFLNMDTDCMIDSFLLTMQQDGVTMMKVGAELSSVRPAEPGGPDKIAALFSYFGLALPLPKPSDQ